MCVPHHVFNGMVVCVPQHVFEEMVVYVCATPCV